MKKVLNVYFLSSDWYFSHRKSFIRNLKKRIGNTLLIQQPVSLTANLIVKFKQKFLGYISGKYKPILTEEGIEIYTPLILFHNRLWSKFKLIAILDSKILVYQVYKYIKKNYGEYIVNLWIYTPLHYYLQKEMNYNNLIYDYYDDFEFDYFGNEIKVNIDLNKKLVPKCDMVLCVSKFTTDRMSKLNKKTISLVNGFEENLFNKNSEFETPEIQNLNKPIVGYSGVLRNWIDFMLLKHLLENSEYYLVCIGLIERTFRKEYDILKTYKNFIHIGYKNIEQIPGYIKKFNVGILPYVNNNFTKSVFPYKFFEYMAMGIPIVSNPLPELKKYENIIGYSYTKEEFVNNCIGAVNGLYNEKLKEYHKILSENTWAVVFNIISENLNEIYKKKGYKLSD